MNFTIKKEDELAIFYLDETRLDSTNSPDVKAELLVLCQEEIDVLIIDLTRIVFCDSTGLSALLLAERQLRERDKGLLVIDKNGKVRSLIDLAKLGKYIPVFDTLEEARKAIVD